MAAKKRAIGRPRKPVGEKKTVYLRVRISEAQESEFKAAAEHAGISLSAWAVERLLRVARQERPKD